jgi:hypothetical protein
MEIYRKPTATDITINNSSCHPKEQKLATYKNWIQRLHTLPLNANNKNKELNTIINIGLNNGYKKADILQLYNKLKLRKNHSEDCQKTTKVGFLYLHRTLHTESYKALQRHQHKNSIQNNFHHR